jgi:hypothetical protein
MIALKYLANTNTDIAIEILEKTDVTNYLITNFENQKPTIIVEDVDIPFGFET